MKEESIIDLDSKKSVAVTPKDLYLLSPEIWAEDKRRISGKQFSLSRYPYLKDVYDDLAKKMVLMKGSQMGLTEYAINKVFWFCDTHNGQVIFTFPTSTDVQHFSASRIKPAIEDSPYFRNKIPNSHVDNVFLKKFASSFIHFRGTFGNTQPISIPSDFNIHDEIDFSNIAIINKFKSRLDHSELKWELFLSTPSYPGWGIHKRFMESNQNHWFKRCGYCKKIFKVCCSYPDIIKQDEKSGKYFYACPHCGRKVNRFINAGWRPSNKKSPIHGYHIAQLIAPWKKAKEFTNLGGYEFKKDFYNFSLGLPFAEGSMQITPNTILACIDKKISWKQSANHCVMGIDQGDKLHYILSEESDDKLKDNLVAIGKTDKWEKLEDLMNNYDVDMCIIDALPNKASAKAFARQFQGRVFVCYYTDYTRFKENWDDEEQEVTVQRTDTLKLMFNEVKNRITRIPNPEEMVFQDFQTHLCNLTKEEVEDKKTGEKKDRFIRSGSDHFAHSNNYRIIARRRVTGDWGDRAAKELHITEVISPADEEEVKSIYELLETKNKSK